MFIDVPDNNVISRKAAYARAYEGKSEMSGFPTSPRCKDRGSKSPEDEAQPSRASWQVPLEDKPYLNAGGVNNR